MRYAFGPMRGHFMGYGDGGATIFWILLAILAIVLIAALVSLFRRKSHPEQARLMSLLKEKYARREISADEYRERKIVLDDEYWLDDDYPEMMRLKERYARCEMASREYCEQREELRAMRNGAAAASFSERTAQ
jgi:putative membrane protein